ncbi:MULTISPECIES: hypothetical protein [unclassified Solwaraspora]|uniref:hypothetical protein n=1 Tax=unclassified Solwaraspora TaxID=2627926 RepID=UPI00248AB537|nr:MULTISPECIES: hypothetical protein [unclassified Solwaraspora]WBB98271.1 hypothetical protein O7553_04870 [Solwaraspora sp. WMMA2059]WBC23174.1 hypothetical protein O7543_12495 [Solwaraspora sp. WMMA2080]WJK34759.1 hypothetical protein O7610_30025 [Solwaraspora sp. WMMA2065]
MTTSPPNSGVRLGVVRGISYGMYGRPERFVPQVRAMNAGLIRVYVYWSQIEPVSGRFDFDVVDALFDQLDGTEEIWVTVCSSSPWATRVPTRLLPPSPAKSLRRYGKFVERLVRHCAGRVHYWQCDNEPTDNALLWAGSAPEYLAQLKVLHKAVKKVDPQASVVLGGAPFMLPLSAPDSHERRFFDLLLDQGRDHFDLFDLHLYGPTTMIPEHVESVRDQMRKFGYEKPVVAGEYNGPWPALFPEAMAILKEPAEAAGGHGRQAEHDAIAKLYARRETLPPTLQMFLLDCPPDLEDKRYRIACREIVMRNLLAFSVGIRRTACWNLAPEAAGFANPYSLMDVMFRTFALMDYAGDELAVRHPNAEALALVAGQLDGAEQVERVPVADRPQQYLFDVRRPGRGPLLVTWIDRDPFHGEDEPDVQFDWSWTAERAYAVDALGRAVPVTSRDGRVHLPVGCTPVFVSAEAIPAKSGGH